jgi:hypothetical protein
VRKLRRRVIVVATLGAAYALSVLAAAADAKYIW